MITRKEGVKEHVLFSGFPADSAGVYGGLSNQVELAAQCPQEFKEDGNPWRGFARKIIDGGATAIGWKPRHQELVAEQFCYFKTLIAGTGTLSKDQILCLAGWMLSEILLEVPAEYIPAPPSEPSERPLPKI